MSVYLAALTFDALDPERLARFWSGYFDWPVTEHAGAAFVVTPADDTGFRLWFVPSDRAKDGPNTIHFDLTSASLEDQQAKVQLALDLGAQDIDIGQKPEEGHVVLADPEGNELCVIEPDNAFLADCGAIGALSCDGSQATGYFWSAALGWPLVWDQDEETAIRSPHGGPKVTWGGPPLVPKRGKERLHLDIAPPADGDQWVEVERLIGLGATRVDIGQGDVDWVVLADPDGHEFCVLTPREPVALPTRY